MAKRNLRKIVYRFLDKNYPINYKGEVDISFERYPQTLILDVFGTCDISFNGWLKHRLASDSHILIDRQGDTYFEMRYNHTLKETTRIFKDGWVRDRVGKDGRRIFLDDSFGDWSKYTYDERGKVTIINGKYSKLPKL